MRMTLWFYSYLLIKEVFPTLFNVILQSRADIVLEVTQKSDFMYFWCRHIPSYFSSRQIKITAQIILTSFVEKLAIQIVQNSKSKAQTICS